MTEQFQITQNRFQYDAQTPNRFELGGRFFTESNASGFLYYVTDQICGSCDNYVTWNTTCLECTPSITITSPNGGERWIAGAIHPIAWIYTGQLPFLEISYSVQSGQSWITIVDTTANMGSYLWTVPGTPSDSCLVRIRSVGDTTVTDESDEPFSICMQPFITVLSPNGGERWFQGDENTVQWTWEGCLDSVALDYTVDGGQIWMRLAESVPNTGTFAWSIPQTPSSDCFVRVSDVTDDAVFDSSDAPFRICADLSLTVLSPNGGEEWIVGSSQPIMWASSECVDEVTLAYSIDSGGDWIPIASEVPDTGSYVWLVPDTPSAACLVKVWDAGDAAVVDSSDDVFSVCQEPSVQVLWPNGGERVIVDSDHDIQWLSTGCIHDVTVLYSVDAGQNWISVSGGTPDDGTFEWTIPNTPSAACLVKIHVFGDTTHFDVSDSLFAIELTPALTLLAPNGGEEWWVGNTYDVLWQSWGPVGDVTLEYSTDSGAGWQAIAETTQNTGVFEWSVPSTPSSLCLVRISDLLTGTVADTSDSLFSIAPAPELSLIAPSGGERWYIGGQYDIQWSFSGSIDLIGIEYSLTGGAAWIAVAESTSNDGLYRWEIPETPSEQCLVRIYDVAHPGVGDTSGTFIMTVLSDITLHTPNGGEIWLVGSTYDIVWSSEGLIDQVSIAYSHTGGLSWITIRDTTLNDGLHEWTVPAPPSLLCLVRVFDVTDHSVADTSDSIFTVREAPTLSLVSPNGGEEWRVADVRQILWSSTGLVPTVTIEYRVTDDSEWIPVVGNTPNDGNYAWTIPNNPSTECWVRMYDSTDSDVADTSDSSFTILPFEMILKVSDGSGNSGSSDNRVHIQGDTRVSLSSLSFSLAYDPSVLTATSIVGTERVADMSRFWWDHTAPGSLGVILEDGILPAGEGVLVSVLFDVSGTALPGEYGLALSACALRDTLGRESLLCATEDGIFTVYPRETFSIAGAIRDNSGQGVEGVTVTLMGDSSEVFTTSASGLYQFHQLATGEYSVLPRKGCWTFQPPWRHYTSLDTNYDHEDFKGFTLGRSFLGWTEGVGETELRDGALEDTFAVWFDPGLPCSLYAVEAAFNTPGTIMIFVWDAGPNAPHHGVAPERGTFPGSPLGDPIVGPFPFTVQGSGDWERLNLVQTGSVPVFGGPDEPGRSFFVGWVKVVPGPYPDNVPHVLGQQVLSDATHSWFGGPWIGPGGPDEREHPWGGYGGSLNGSPPVEYAVRLDVSFPWCPLVVSAGLPDVAGDEGDTLSVPLYVYSNVTGLDVRSYACEIGYDETLLEVHGCVSLPGDMTRDWGAPTCQADVPGRLMLSQAGSSALVGTGMLIHLQFRLLSGWRECSDLTFVEFVFNDGTPQVSAGNGRICVEAGSQRCHISGRVLHYATRNPVAETDLVFSAGDSDTIQTDGDGFYIFERRLCSLDDTLCASMRDYPSHGVTAYDAALVAQTAAGMITLSPLQHIAGDVSANCAVSTYDAALIARYAAELISSFPTGPWMMVPEKETVTEENWCSVPSCLMHTPLAMNRDGQDFLAVPVGDVSGNWSSARRMFPKSPPIPLWQDMILTRGQVCTLPLLLAQEEEIVALDLGLTYDPSVLTLEAASRTAATEDFMLVVNHRAGGAALSLYGRSPVRGSEAVLELRFLVIGEEGARSLLKVNKLLVNERSVAVAETRLSVRGNLPHEYGLEQNVPNPFNPVTTIRYHIPRTDGPVRATLTLYNVLGQEIKRLVEDDHAAGTYDVVWDGTDDKGCKVSSGIYFYRLGTDTFVQTRKMVYLR